MTETLNNQEVIDNSTSNGNLSGSEIVNEKNLGGRPDEFKEEYITRVDDYLATRRDEEIDIVKQANSEKGYEMYERKLKVKLPTIEGFALFIGVSKKSVYNWEKEYPKFLHALDKIRIEQQERLLDKGLSGDYNSTIAKLILSSNHGMREKTELSGDKENPITINKVIYGDYNSSQIPTERIPDTILPSDTE